MKKILIFLLAPLVFLTSVTPAHAQLNLCPKDTSQFAILCDIDISNALPTVISFALILAVIVALVYLIWGGIKWITSGGDKGNVETARNQIIAAVIGLIVTFLAWFILNLVLTVFLGSGDGSKELQLPTVDGGGGSDPGNGTNKRTGAQCSPSNKPDSCRKGKSLSCVRGRWRCQ